MKKIIFSISVIFIFMFLTNVLVVNAGSIFDTKHNLSISGKGEIKSVTETRVCIFCHSSHNTSDEGPLWNHETNSQSKFNTYSSVTLKQLPDQPNGSTKLCLSCHDGTIAVGAVRNRTHNIQMTGVSQDGTISANRKSNFGIDLAGTHPVSIKYRQSTTLAVDHLRWPPLDPENKVGPDANGYVQCTACHDPHDNSRSDRYPFWNKTTFNEVCLTCHEF